MIALRALFAFRLFAAALLATIGLQAVPAAPMAPVAAHGSAFSSSTAEVAVLNLRRDLGPSPQQTPVPWSGPLPDRALPPSGREIAARLPATPPLPRMAPVVQRDFLSAEARPRAPPIA